MYHFVASCHPDPLVLSERVQVPRHIRQYLRDFQVEAVQFLYNHFANGDFCILNDESGLGKCVATTVFLGATAKLRRCLIVVGNDDESVTGWQFHLNILTNLSVATLEAKNCELNPVPNITIAKWATLRTIGDTSKYNFEFIVIDNRSEMLSNNFCMSMLLHNYDNKVNLLISSVDVTSDLKLLHNALRLGGRLEHQYTQFKAFEAKYKLPNGKDVLNKEISLEEYFLRREMLSNYCKEFRLRRYAHQYEDKLPFVDVDRYKISLDLWRTIGSSGSIQNANEITHSETPTEELFENELAAISEISQVEEVGSGETRVDDHITKDISDDLITMSPLLVDSESCTSDEVESLPPTEHHRQNSHNTQSDVYEFVDLSTEEDIPRYNNDNGKKKENLQKRVRSVETNEHIIIIDESNIIFNQSTEQKECIIERQQSKQVSDSAIEKESSKSQKHKSLTEGRIQKDVCDSVQKENESTPQRVTRSAVKTVTNLNMGRRTKSKAKSIENQKRYNLLKHRKSEHKPKQNVILVKQLRHTKANLAEPISQTIKRKSNENKSGRLLVRVHKIAANINQIPEKRQKRTFDVDKGRKDISTSNIDSQLNVANERYSTRSRAGEDIKGKISKKVKGEKSKVRRKERFEELPSLIRNTRSMQRMTRSSESTRVSKYMSPLPVLRTDRKVGKLKKAMSKEEVKENTCVSKDKQLTNVKDTNKVNKKTEIISNTKKYKTTKDKLNELSILSFSDCEEMQCGQKLVSDTNVEQNVKDGFLVPPTPPRVTRQQESNRIYLPTPSSIFESDVIFVSSSGVNNKSQQHIVHISSSPDEGSLSSHSSQSRRTRALKQNRVAKTLSTRTNNIEQTLPTFGELLNKQQQKEQIQIQRKSPDIFTASTDLGLTCTQQPPAVNISQQRSDTFQGFKIFGSEVKQFQQQHALTPVNTTSKQTLNRSCLNILEKMFEPASGNRNKGTVKPNTNGNATTKILTTPTQHQQQQKQRTPAVNLVKKSTRCKQMVVPTLPNADISSLMQDSKNKPTKYNKATMTNESRQIVEEELFEITNNDAFGSLMRVNSNGEISPVQSGKSTQNGQHNKITNYLTQRMPTEPQIEVEERTLGSATPKKRTQQQFSSSAPGSIANLAIRRSPKQTKTTQTTKLTKWFQKNSNETTKTANVHAEKKTSILTSAGAASPSTAARKQTRSTASKQLRRKRLELSFKN